MSPASRPKRGNANTAEARVSSPPLSSSSDAAAKDAPLLFDRFHPADPNAKSLHPLPPNRRPDFELFGPDELMVMVNCQLEVYTEKHATIEQRCLGLRALHRGGLPWTDADLMEYGVLKSYRELLHEKKTFWENLYNEAYQYKIEKEREVEQGKWDPKSTENIRQLIRLICDGS